MLDEERSDLIWKIKSLFQRYSLASVDCIVVSSFEEITSYADRLHISKDKMRTVLFHTNIVEPRLVKGDGRYILAAGKAGRDYAVLAEAVRDIDVEVIIISDEASIAGIAFPKNVRVMRDVPYDRYLQVLYKCQIVVVPLFRLVSSTGQVAILEAMGLGKPVIATATTGTIDYIESGRTGVLVPPGDADALKDAISALLRDHQLQDNIARRALEKVKRSHTFEAYTTQILDLAAQLVTAHPSLMPSQAPASQLSK